jgi:hypothetical protein
MRAAVGIAATASSASGGTNAAFRPNHRRFVATVAITFTEEEVSDIAIPRDVPSM